MITFGTDRWLSQPTEAAEVMMKNRTQFNSNVTQSLHGGTINGVKYDSVLV